MSRDVFLATASGLTAQQGPKSSFYPAYDITVASRPCVCVCSHTFLGNVLNHLTRLKVSSMLLDLPLSTQNHQCTFEPVQWAGLGYNSWEEAVAAFPNRKLKNAPSCTLLKKTWPRFCVAPTVLTLHSAKWHYFFCQNWNNVDVSVWKLKKKEKQQKILTSVTRTLPPANRITENQMPGVLTAPWQNIVQGKTSKVIPIEKEIRYEVKVQENVLRV